MKFHQDYCEEQMSKKNDVNRWKMKLKMLELWCKKILNGKKAKEMKKSFEEFKKKVKTKFHFSEEKDYGNCY